MKMTPAVEVTTRPVKENTRVFSQRVGAGSGATGMATPHVPAPSTGLAGKTATIAYDGGLDDAIYRLNGSWKNSTGAEDGGGRETDALQPWETVPGVFLPGHVLSSTKDHEGHISRRRFRERQGCRGEQRLPQQPPISRTELAAGRCSAS